MSRTDGVISLSTFSGDAEFSQDQWLFYHICLGVISGVISANMIGRVIGKLCHSRWLTLGTRILCTYISTPNPCKNLRLLAEFVIRGYASSWYRIRLNPRGTEAPRLMFYWMKELITFPPEVKDAVMPIFNNGCFWFHSENLLLAALADSRETRRKQAVDQILRIRNDEDFKAKAESEQKKLKQSKKCAYKKQRIFLKPNINYEAEDYLDVICWDTQAYFEPPYTKDMRDDEIRAFISEPLCLNVPSHSVLTERLIRDVDRIVSQSTSGEMRDGMMRSLLEERKQKPKLDTKTDLMA